MIPLSKCTVKMLLKIVSVLIVLSVNIADIKSAKILAVFPVPSLSHQVVFRPLTQELVKRGHQVTVITPNPAFSKENCPENLKEIDIHDVSYQFWRNSFLNDYKPVSRVNFRFIRQILQLLSNMFEMQLKLPEIQVLINNKNNKYDLILIEAMIRPALVFSYIFEAPVILVSSLGVVLNYHKVLGLQTHPILFPTLNNRIYNLTLIEKLDGIYNYYSADYANYLNEFHENQMLKNIFGTIIPPISELYDNITMLFVNIHPTWADNQPVPPNVLFIGGIHILPEKELPKDLQTYLDSSKHGVIYVSFGTNVLADVIPKDKVKIIVKVLSELPYDVLWKWDKNELPGPVGNNIRLSKWFPQSDLLRHNKVKLFITQAGLQSTDEAIIAGVPLVAIPMLADQGYNAEKYVKHGIGKKMDIETLTAEDLKSAVETVINDSSYRNSVMRLREIRRDQPISPLQSAVWWTEYVIRHGGARHLRSAAANLSYAEYFEIEVLLIICSVTLIILILFATAVIFIVRAVRKCFLKRKVKTK